MPYSLIGKERPSQDHFAKDALYSVDLLTFVLFFLCLNYKNDNISLLALTNNIYFIGGESYGASIEHSFLTRKQGLFQLFKFDTFSRWVTVCTTCI